MVAHGRPNASRGLYRQREVRTSRMWLFTSVDVRADISGHCRTKADMSLYAHRIAWHYRHGKPEKTFTRSDVTRLAPSASGAGLCPGEQDTEGQPEDIVVW